MRRLALPFERWFAALARLPGHYWLRAGARVFAGALPVAESHRLDPEPILPLRGEKTSFPRWVGLLPYEAFRDVERRGKEGDLRPPAPVERPLWQRYRSALLIEAGQTYLLGETEADALELGRALEKSSAPSPVRAGLSRIEGPEPDAVHRTRIERALAAIGRGELYQVNLARRFELAAMGTPLELLRLFSESEGPLGIGGALYAFALDAPDLGVVSLSPELCLAMSGERTVYTSPIKGTRPRGVSAVEDARNARDLEENEKERAELAMVVDLERNDLSRVAETGSVVMTEPPRVVSHSTVHHRQATVSAVLRPEIDRTALLRAFLPSGSVTGAPKAAAMEWIAELEADRRGLYTGAVGFIGQEGELFLSMAIRCFTVRQGRAVIHSGGGIVSDSVAALEVEETRWKMRQFQRIVGSAFC